MTILVPTDFSETSKKAAQYAIFFAKQLHIHKLVLFNSCERHIETDQSLPSVVPDFTKQAIEASRDALERFKLSLLITENTELEIETFSMYGFLPEVINDVAIKFNAVYIVMGVTGSDTLNEAFIGSFAIDVSKESKVPVIIVPPNATITPIKEIMFACDFENVQNNIPVEEIKNLLDATKAKLFIFNTNKDHHNASANAQLESNILSKIFEKYKPDYGYKESEDFVDGINDYALEKEVDMIITIPKKQGLFEGLFKKNRTKMLAFHSHLPLMVIHEQ